MQQTFRSKSFRDVKAPPFFNKVHAHKREPIPNILIKVDAQKSILLNELKSYEVYDFEKVKYDVHDLEKHNFELYKIEKQNHENRHKKISEDVFNHLVNPLFEPPPIEESCSGYNDINKEISIFFPSKS